MTDPAPVPPFPPPAPPFQVRPVSAARRRRPLAPAPAAGRPAAGRGGFTLIEMLIAVALVLLMMTLFAQVFGLASETVSARKGMAANDQKSRLLASRFRADLSARTFERVVPFAGATVAYDQVLVDHDNDPATPAQMRGWRLRQATEGGVPLVSLAGQKIWEAEPQSTRGFGGMDDREGYFSISENDPDDDRDDVISFTTDTSRRRGAGDGLARARAWVMPAPNLTAAAGKNPTEVFADQPAFDIYNTGGESDDGFGTEANDTLAADLLASVGGVNEFGVGASQYEVITFFLRNGSLIRSRKLVRGPATDPELFDQNDSPTENNEADDWPPTAGGPSFGNFFDYAAYRHPDPNQLGPRFHSAASLSNSADVEEIDNQGGVGLREVRLPVSLGNPFLRDGAGALSRSGEDLLTLFNPAGGIVSPNFVHRSFGRPREFAAKFTGFDLRYANVAAGAGLTSNGEWNSAFLGRYTNREQADPDFNLPGRGVAPQNGPYFHPNLAAIPADKTWWQEVAANNDRLRRGEEILVSNVHAFDIKVYDDAIGDFVDLGHTRTVQTNDLFDADGDDNVAEEIAGAGDYHADRLLVRNWFGQYGLDADGNGVLGTDLDGDGNSDPVPHPFGNRFDTWHPGLRLTGVGYPDADGDGSPDSTAPGDAVTVDLPYPPPYRPLRSPLGGDVGVPTRQPGTGLTPLAAVDLTFTGVGLVPEYRDQNGNVRLYRDTGRTTTRALESELGGTAALPFFAPPGDDSSEPFVEGFDTGGNPAVYPNPNQYGALGSDDEKPLRAIEITVRYYDVQSDRMREESFRHSLVD